MKNRVLLAESFFDFIKFQRKEISPENIGIGKKYLIKVWMRQYSNLDEDEYHINNDFTIDTYQDLEIKNQNISELPSYIKFNVAHKSFYAQHNPLKSLKGFPKIVKEDLSIISYIPGAKKWSEKEIKKNIKVKGNIFN